MSSRAKDPLAGFGAAARRGVCEEHAVAIAQEAADVSHFPADRLVRVTHRVPGLGVAHELGIGGHLVPAARGQDGERDAAGVEVHRVLQVPGRDGAALALPLVRRAVPPHVLVDQELVAALEQVQERDRAAGAGDLDLPVELHHRQPAAGRGEGVAFAGVGFLADQKLVTGSLPGSQVNHGRAAGQRGGRVVWGAHHGVSVMSHAGQPVCRPAAVTRQTRDPVKNHRVRGTLSPAWMRSADRVR